MIDLNFDIDLSIDEQNLPIQIARQVRVAIEAKRLRAGDRIPSSRRLARELSIARGTVTTALDILIAEGLLESKQGSGTFVSKDVGLLHNPLLTESNVTWPELDRHPVPDIDAVETGNKIDLRPCRPCTASFPLNEWRRCASLAASQRPSSDYSDPKGRRSLRQEIASYLRRGRGLDASPENIIITNGAVHAMHLLARLFASSGDVAIEDPGYPLARQVFELAGMKSHSVPVDQNGLRVDQLSNLSKPIKLAYVTPSHQFPLGSRLSLKRRHDLIEWAGAREALIVEDDYDGEFRYDVPSLAPLAALAPGVVVYCGTFSKTLFPDLRIGFAVAPRPIIDAMANLRAISEYAPPILTQLTLENFIRGGFFERHVQKMRKTYRQKRQTVVDIVRSVSSSIKVVGLESGLSTILELPANLCADRLKARAGAAGVLVETINRYVHHPQHKRNGLVVGYAQPTIDEIESGLNAIFGSSH